MPSSPRFLVCATALFMTMTPCMAAAETPTRTLDNLVQNIIKLRGDLEGLDARIQRLESEHEARMSSLAQREGELAAQTERQELNMKQLERKLVDLRGQSDKAGVAARQLTPALKAAIDGVRQYVQTSLPFKRSERLAVLDDMLAQLDRGTLKAPRLANRLWSFYSDELRLTGDSAVYRQPIVIQGQERLVDVARLGMMSLYFRGDDGRFGYAARAGDDWIYRYLSAGAPTDEVAALFGALRKQLDTGFYRLPYPIAARSLQQAARAPLRQAEAR